MNSIMEISAQKASGERSKKGRLDFRIDAEMRLEVERAAALENRTLTEFCLSALARVTRETIARHESLQLSARDREIVFDSLIHPPEPNERLRRAFASAEETLA